MIACTYVEGFVIPVPRANREAFITLSSRFDARFIEHGALRVVECWGDDVPPGQQTDFYRAVAAAEDETVCFSWIEWPDRATRDREQPLIEAEMRSDPLFDPAAETMPFDTRRMIFGGFVPVVDLARA